MKRIQSLYLLVTLILLSSCSEEVLRSDISAEASQQMTLQQRVGQATAQIQANEFTRWDAPWWEMSDEDMADSLRATDGEVIISFKEPDQAAGVDLKGKVLVSNQTRDTGIEAITVLGAEILRKSKLHPSVFAKIPVNIELISTLRNHPLVDIFEPNVTGTYTNVTWNIDRVNAPDVWGMTTGSGTRLLIIDSGIDNNHNDLNPAVIQACDDSNGLDQFGHGTYVSGVAAALQNGQDVAGVAHGVELWSSKVGTTAPSTNAVRCAVEFGRVNNVQVMNMSLSVTMSSALTDQINGAYNQDNIVLVAAAGNTSGGDVTYPANLSTVIAVTATDINDNRWDGAAIGPEIEIAAPGVNIESTDLGGGTTFVTGTSFAAPHVAGAAALLRSYNSSLTNEEIRTRLTETAQPIAGTQNEVGNGLLDVEAALAFDPALEVTIIGPTFLETNQMGTWTANVENASGSVSYQWFYTDSSTSDWIPGGTNSDTFSHAFTVTSNTSTDTGVRVDVTSGNEQDTDILYVFVTSEDCDPVFEICEN